MRIFADLPEVETGRPRKMRLDDAEAMFTSYPEVTRNEYSRGHQTVILGTVPSGHKQGTGRGASMDSFADRVELATGATRGIGRATAVAFASEDARVVFCGRHERWSDETARVAREAAGEATFVRADVTVEEVAEAQPKI